MFDVTSKLGYHFNFSILNNPKKQDFEFGRKPKEHPIEDVGQTLIKNA